MKKLVFLSGSLLLLVLTVSTGLVSAQQFKSQDNITVTKDQKIDSAVYYSGNNIDISGDINGDLYCAGSTINISGNINGDIFCAGQNINLSGKVDGSARLAGQNINISGQLIDGVSVFAQSVIISDRAIIGRDLNGGASTLSINQGAKIMRDLTVGATDININGSIGRNIKSAVESLTLGSSSSVGGSIDYTSDNLINQDEGSKVSGSITQNQPKQESSKPAILFPLASAIFSLYLLVSMLVTSLVLILIFPKKFEDVNNESLKSIGKTTLIGAVNIFIVPFGLLFLLITVLGIPLAFLSGLVWMITLILSGPLFAYFIGRQLMKGKRNSVLVMMAGSVVLLLLYAIPIVNIFAALAAGVYGSGMVVKYGLSKLSKPSYNLTK